MGINANEWDHFSCGVYGIGLEVELIGGVWGATCLWNLYSIMHTHF